MCLLEMKSTGRSLVSGYQSLLFVQISFLKLTFYRLAWLEMRCWVYIRIVHGALVSASPCPYRNRNAWMIGIEIDCSAILCFGRYVWYLNLSEQTRNAQILDKLQCSSYFLWLTIDHLMDFWLAEHEDICLVSKVNFWILHIVLLSPFMRLPKSWIIGTYDSVVKTVFWCSWASCFSSQVLFLY